MLFFMSYANREDVAEDISKRTLALFTQWTPPDGYEFKAHYAFAEGGGGFAIIEASTATAILEAHAPFAPYFHFRTTPIVEIGEAVPLFQKTNEWRDSIS